jgi:hypothetical protein
MPGPDAYAVRAFGAVESVTCTVNVPVPLDVGVPVIAPVDEFNANLPVEHARLRYSSMLTVG